MGYQPFTQLPDYRITAFANSIIREFINSVILLQLAITYLFKSGYDSDNRKESVMDKDLFERALEMSPNERLAFAELILASLEQEDDEVRTAWVKEVRARMKAVNEGKSRLLDFEALYHAG